MVLRACRSLSTCPLVKRHLAGFTAVFDATCRPPWEGLPMVILLHARNLFCVEDRCRQKVFMEQLPGS